MARGWESKSVEDQMSNLPEADSSNASASTEEAKRVAEVARQDKLRQLQALNLQRENILSQRTSNPVRRTALAAALELIEAQIAALN